MLIFRFLARESFHEITVREFAFLSTHSVNLLPRSAEPSERFYAFTKRLQTIITFCAKQRTVHGEGKRRRFLTSIELKYCHVCLAVRKTPFIYDHMYLPCGAVQDTTYEGISFT